MNKYTLTCTDGKDTTTNQLDSLEEIIFFIVEWYGKDDLTGYELTTENGMFCLFYEISMEQAYQYEFNKSKKAVAETLNEIAENHGKNHTFKIIEN